MTTHFCITIRFLQPFSHGRGDGGEPEWPPSPLRVFQALVAASAARWNERTRIEYAVPALGWLVAQPAPAVVASAGAASDVKYRMYVPDNVADKVAKSWRGGNANASIADYRTEKDVRPTHLIGKDGEFPSVHYLYPVADAAEFANHKQTLIDAARSVTHLGWGVDMVAGNAQTFTEEQLLAEEKAGRLTGEHWRPTADGSGTTQLRVPRAGTLDKLMEKHTAFLGRLQGDGFKPVPPLTAFDTVGYRRDTDPASRPWVAFRITSVDPDDNNPSFDTPTRCRDVAAWVRHATGEVCGDWSDVASFVHGHAENGNRAQGERADERFMFLPLPTVNAKLGRVESIRRVLIAAPPKFQERIEWIRRRLPGQVLAWGDDAAGLLDLLSTSDWVLGRYTGESRVWSTVTPVVLPGHDDPDGIRKKLREQSPEAPMTADVKNRRVEELERRTRGLLEKAFRHAGFTEEVIGGLGLEWRNVGFRAGVDLASRYALPDRLNGPRYHVRVRFAHPVRGPLAVGSGRYRGMGLFAAESD